MQSEVERVLRPELGPGEKLLWSGQPHAGLRLRPFDVVLIPFSLFWAVGMVSWELGVIQDGAPLLFVLGGIPGLLAGLYFVVGRFFHDALVRSRTYYGVTNERVLIASGGFNRQVKSLALRQLPEIALAERGDRSGTITFGPISNSWFAGSNWPGASKYFPPSFDLIDNARQVYVQIQAAQRALQPVGAKDPATSHTWSAPREP